MGCTRQTCGHTFKNITLAESVPADSVTDGTIILLGPNGEGVTEGDFPPLGVVYAPGCERTFGPGDCVDVQCTGEAPVKVAADAEGGQPLGTNGEPIPEGETAATIGSALTTATAGGVATVLLGSGLATGVKSSKGEEAPKEERGEA